MATVLEIRVEGEASAAQGALASVRVELEALVGAAEDTGASFGEMTGAFALGEAAGEALTEALHALGEQLMSVVEVGGQMEEANAKLVAEIKATGDASGETMAQLQQLAQAQADNTKFSKEQTESAEAVALTFKSISRNVFPDVIKVAEDMSTIFGTDVNSSVLQIGKAMDAVSSGNAKELKTAFTTLHREGISFSESQKQAIEAMLEAGNTAGAEAEFMQVLKEQVGGAAEAVGQTLPGQLAILGHHFDDIKERIYDGMQPALAELISKFNDPALLERVGQIADTIGSVLGQAIDWIANTAIPAMVAAWQTIQPAIEEAGSALATIGQIFADLAGQAFGWGQNIIAQLADGIGSMVGAVMGELQSIGDAIASLLAPGSPPKLLPNLTDWGAGAINAYLDGFRNADMSVFTDLGSMIAEHMPRTAGLSGQALTDAKAQEQYAYHVADTAGKLKILQSELSNTRAGSAEYFGILTKIYDIQQSQDKSADSAAAKEKRKEEQEHQKELREAARLQKEQQKVVEEAKQAQFQYNLSLADADGKIKLVSDKLATLTPGTKEYYQTELELHKLQQDKNKQLEEAAKKQDELNKLSFEASMAGKDHAEKVAMLTERMKTLTPGTKEYYDTLKQLNSETAAAEKAAERAAHAHHGHGAAMGGAAGHAQNFARSLNEALKPLQESIGHVTEATNRIKEFTASIHASADAIETRFKAAIQNIKAVVLPAWTEITSFIHDEVGTITTYVPDMLTAMSRTIKAILDTIQIFWMQNGDLITSTLEVNWDQIKNIVTLGTALVMRLVTAAWSLIATFIGEHQTGIQAVLAGSWDIIQGIITGALAIIEGLIQASLDIMSGNWEGAWQTIQAMCVTVTVAIGSIIEGFFQIITGAVDSNLSTMVTTWTDSWSMLQEIVGKITSSISSTVGRWASDVAGFFGRIKDAIQGLIDKAHSVANALSNISIPSWLQGHSPPPMANWFNDIADSIQTTNVRLPVLRMNLMPTVGGAAAYAQGGMTTNYNTTVNAPMSNYGAPGMGPDELAQAVIDRLSDVVGSRR